MLWRWWGCWGTAFVKLELPEDGTSWPGGRLRREDKWEEGAGQGGRTVELRSCPRVTWHSGDIVSPRVTNSRDVCECPQPHAAVSTLSPHIAAGDRARHSLTLLLRVGGWNPEGSAACWLHSQPQPSGRWCPVVGVASRPSACEGSRPGRQLHFGHISGCRNVL